VFGSEGQFVNALDPGRDNMGNGDSGHRVDRCLPPPGRELEGQPKELSCNPLRQESRGSHRGNKSRGANARR